MFQDLLDDVWVDLMRLCVIKGIGEFIFVVIWQVQVGWVFDYLVEFCGDVELECVLEFCFKFCGDLYVYIDWLDGMMFIFVMVVVVCV